MVVKNIIDLNSPSSSVKTQEISGEIHPRQQEVNKPMIITIAASFILLGLAYVFFQENVLTAIFFFLISLIILIFAFKEKQAIPWEITRHGFTVDAFFYPFQDLKSFWIEYQPGQIKEISFKSKKWYRGYFKIPLNQENPLKIREVLLEFLPEEKHEDTLIETIGRKLGI